MARKILFFELNEVPFRILDAYRSQQPDSTLGRRLDDFSQFETHAPDEVPLSPWITWPTLHRGVSYETHRIRALGQDLRELDTRYPPLWKRLVDAGVSVGVGGSLHTYPVPDRVERYAFFLPDTFAAGPEAHPDVVEAFQDFNLAMARDSARSVSSRIRWKPALRVLARMPQLGLRPSTLADVARQLASERRKPWLRVRRRSYQSVLAFDVFMKQLGTHQPGFTTFFTNHVASALHRYWAATFPEDYDEFTYDDAWVERWQDEIPFAMNRFDRMLRRLLGFVDAHPEYVLMIASSMGQGPTETVSFSTHLTMNEPERFLARLGVPEGAWTRKPAMEPDVNVQVEPEHAERFRRALDKLVVDEKPFLYREAQPGFFNLVVGGTDLHTRPAIACLDGQPVPFEELGLTNAKVEDEAGGSAYHVPEGILLLYDPRGDAPDRSRRQVSTTDIAPWVLRSFGLPVPADLSDAEALPSLAAG